MTRTSIRAAASFLIVLATAGTVEAAGGSLRGSVMERERSDGSRSLGVTISEELVEELPTGRDFTSIALLVPGRRMRGIEPGHLPAGWTFDARNLSASGPAIRSGDFRFDFPATWKPPQEIGVECFDGTQSVFREQLEVVHRPSVRVGNDHTEWVDLPRTLRVGSEFRLESLTRDKFRLGLRWGFENREPGLSLDWRPEGDWRVARVPDPFSIAFEPKVDAVRPWQQPFTVRGFDRWGELWVQDTWQPVFLPALVDATDPFLTAASEILAPNSQLCLCGNVPELDAWSDFRIGGLNLGAPIAATSSSALFALPQGLSPGRQPIEFLGEQPLRVPEGLGSTAVQVGGEVREDVINKGGTTPLILRIVGSDRQFPVVLENKTPQYIELEDGPRVEQLTSGGSPNEVRKNVTGLKATPPGERFRVAYRVGLPTCPCDEQDQQVAETVGAAFEEFMRRCDGEPSAEIATTVGEHDLPWLAQLDLGLPRLEDNPFHWSPIAGEEIVGFFFGIPITRSMAEELVRGLGRSPDCTTGSNRAVVGDGRFAVELDVEIAPDEGGSCGDGKGASFHSLRAGVSLSIEPLVSAEGSNVFLIVDHSPVAASHALTITEIDSGRTATISTQVRVRSGETVAIGGLRDTRVEESEHRVPWLGDVPIVGTLFRDRSGRSTSETLIVITPKIVRGTEQ